MLKLAFLYLFSLSIIYILYIFMFHIHFTFSTCCLFAIQPVQSELIILTILL